LLVLYQEKKWGNAKVTWQQQSSMDIATEMHMREARAVGGVVLVPPENK
jgi:hypothetical protein